MSTIAPSPHTADWRERLGLAGRRPPELYESSSAVADASHGPAIRAALDDMGVTALFCVQGVPTVAILEAMEYVPAKVINIHGQLWNQGLASILLVVTGSVLRVFSLARTPLLDTPDAFETRCLIETLEATTEYLRSRNLISGVESGRLWHDYARYFPSNERIDRVLLDNLSVSHDQLQQSLCPAAAQALLIQTMFIAYLEDREIVTASYFQALSDDRASSFASLLETHDVELLRTLFETLRTDFNGDLFVTPCSFELEDDVPEIAEDHMAILARFRSGRVEISNGGQQRFWGYNFRYIPIELVSAVYDRFLGDREDDRRSSGAYYTPMFVADTVVSQVWELLSEEVKIRGRVVDPACGSGVFLVRVFQRLCEHWRSKYGRRSIPWPDLLSLLSRIHGWDINGGAVRVAVFSLYVGLLEEVSPPDIRRLIRIGNVLPELWGKTLVRRDFFSVVSEAAKFELVVGNPPWASRRGSERTSRTWCRTAGLPMPGGEDAWAFAWKTIDHLSPDGLVGFLLPSMGFLHNQAKNAASARVTFFRSCHVRRVINFADLRFQLFENAHRPAALFLYTRLAANRFPYSFEYWVPKADLNLRTKRVITLSTNDRVVLNVATVMDEPLVFKQRLWMREPDAKLFSYLSSLPRLGDLVEEYGNLRRRKQDPSRGWVIGQGYQPFSGRDRQLGAVPVESAFVGRLSDLPVTAYERYYQPTDQLSPALSRVCKKMRIRVGIRRHTRACAARRRYHSTAPTRLLLRGTRNFPSHSTSYFRTDWRGERR